MGKLPNCRVPAAVNVSAFLKVYLEKRNKLVYFWLILAITTTVDGLYEDDIDARPRKPTVLTIVSSPLYGLSVGHSCLSAV